MRIALALGLMLGMGLAACTRSPEVPKGSDVAAAMPDTTAARAPDRDMTAPDAGATGAVPANGGEPAVAATPPTAMSATEHAPPK